MPAAAGELYLTTIRRLILGQLIENVIMMREIGGLSTTAQIKASAESLRETFRTVTGTGVTFLETTIQRVTPSKLDAEFVALTVGHEGGTQLSSYTNTILSCVCTERTGAAGKRHRGRMYIPVTEEQVNQGRLSTTGSSQFASFAAEIMTKFADGSGTDGHLAIGIYSKVIGGTSPYTVAGWQPITSIVPQAILGSQRRRRIGVGA